MNLSYFQKINNLYKTSNLNDGEIYNVKQQINDGFTDTIDYHFVEKSDGTKQGLIIVHEKDKHKKSIKSRPDETIDYGCYYKWNNVNWLVINVDSDNQLYVSAEMQECNNYLKWIDKDGKTQSYPCISEEITKVSPNYNKLVITQQGDIVVTVQQNADTNLLTINTRFLFGIQNNYSAFRIDFVDNFTESGLLVLYMRVDTLAAEDDLVNGIASNNNKITPIPPVSGKQDLITPNVNTIYQGTDNIQTFNVYAYSNSVKQTDTFTVAISGVASSYYTLKVIDGNTFSIVNNYGMYMDTKLHILCTDKVDNSTAIMDVVLGGDF